MSKYEIYTKPWRESHHKEYLEQKKRWREKHKIEIQESNRKYNERIRFEVLSHYSGNPPKCTCCGESNIQFLTIDHINNDGNVHRRNLGKFSGGSFYVWLIRNRFPDGFQVLCFNCNCGKAHNNGICPHKTSL